MSNRVIKDRIWWSPTLAKLESYYQDQFVRWLLMADDWGCFNADPFVISGLVYPKRKENPEDVKNILTEFNKNGLLFIWEEKECQWGFFVSWDNHHSYCNKTNLDDGGKHQRHRRKTPEPPFNPLKEYKLKFKNE